MFKYKKQDKKDFIRTSNFFQITCPGTSSTFQYFHTPVNANWFTGLSNKQLSTDW
jgi:hypothetical protein